MTGGALIFDSKLNNAVVSVSNAGTTVDFGVSQLLTSLDIGDDTVVTLGGLPPPAPLAGLESGFGAELGGAPI